MSIPPPKTVPGPAPDSTPSTPAALIAQLEEQLERIEELARLTMQQSLLVKEGETAALLDVLAQRQRVIEKFADGQGRLGEMAGAAEASFAEIDSTGRDRIRSLLGGIETRLAEVMATDAEDQATLEANRDTTRGELGALHHGRAAQTAYRTQPTEGARFADRKG